MLDGGLDQASGLRSLFGKRGLRLLAVADGPCKPGASAFVLNLAAALARIGLNPVIIDGQRDGVSGMLGLPRRHELSDLLEADRSFASVATRTAEGFSVLPAERGLARIAADPDAAEATFSALAALSDGFDIALVSAPDATIGALIRRSGAETALLCGPGDKDLTATYARMKTLVRKQGLSRFRVVFGGSSLPAAVAVRHQRLAAVADRYLAAAVEYGGAFDDDDSVGRALLVRASVFAVAERGRVARAFERIASAAREWQLPAYQPAGATIH